MSKPPILRRGFAPTHPGAFFRDEVLEPLGVSVTNAAEALGVRRATLSDLVNGKARPRCMRGSARRSAGTAERPCC